MFWLRATPHEPKNVGKRIGMLAGIGLLTGKMHIFIVSNIYLTRMSSFFWFIFAAIYLSCYFKFCLSIKRVK